MPNSCPGDHKRERESCLAFKAHRASSFYTVDIKRRHPWSSTRAHLARVQTYASSGKFRKAECDTGQRESICFEV